MHKKIEKTGDEMYCAHLDDGSREGTLEGMLEGALKGLKWVMINNN